MKEKDREIKESPLYQGEDESIAYTLTTTPWVSSPTSPTVKLFRMDGNTRTDVSSTNLSGSPSANGDIITTPLVTGLVSGTIYRMEIKWVVSGNTFETYTMLQAQV